MSEWINKAKIAEANKINTELNQKIKSLQEELDTQCRELDHLRELATPDEDITHLKEKITAYEQRKLSDKQHIESIIEQAKHVQKVDSLVEQFFSILQVHDDGSIAVAIDKFYKKHERSKLFIVFLLGALVPLVVWVATDASIIQQLIERITRLING
ncbi:hypothetical protein [Pelovirga terrestris]|uniref:Uncharacterized protein n=1 Tax=Pelovirga terrestris TaxID=2771352 RepID=A0A8J6QLQ2_9BACT|nr:hypothetical protein [Pelovirga terrestris]MBD1399278.1 hypothetical protein [Pelovirga terrestris]